MGVRVPLSARAPLSIAFLLHRAPAPLRPAGSYSDASGIAGRPPSARPERPHPRGRFLSFDRAMEAAAFRAAPMCVGKLRNVAGIDRFVRLRSQHLKRAAPLVRQLG